MKNIIDHLASQYPHHEWELIQKRSVRSVYRLDRNGVPEFFVKIYDPATLAGKLRNLVMPRTLHEARMLSQLKEACILVPEVHGHVRLKASSALVTRAVVPARSLFEAEPGKCREIMLGLAVSLLNNGFVFTDMHAGNIVLDSDDRPYLLDAYEIVPKKKITAEHVVCLFSQVLASVEVPDEELSDALKMLRLGFGVDGLAETIRSRFLTLRRRHVKKRVKHSLRQGSFSRVVTGHRWKALIRQECCVDLDDILSRHKRNIAEGRDVLKFQEKTQLSRVGDYCVKTYMSPRFMCSPYALRSWKGLLTLYYNRIDVADPVAVAVFEDKSSVLVTRMLDLPDLDAFIWVRYAALSGQERKNIAHAFGTAMGILHSLNIYHADLKACNIKVEEESGQFYFIDTDRITQKQKISYTTRLKNLVQINTSIPVCVSRGMRMTFLEAYAGFTHDDPEVLFRDVWAGSCREEIVFRTPDGDRVETWPEKK